MKEKTEKKDEACEHEVIDLELEKSSLESLKESYEVIKKSYGLPDFDDLNENFQIEKLQGKETDFLLREVREQLSDKFSSYLKLIETLIQPNNAPMFVYWMLKSLDKNESKKLHELYRRLTKKEIEVFNLDLKYDAQKEADFIKSSYSLFNEIRNDLSEIMQKIENSWPEEENNEEKPNNYLG